MLKKGLKPAAALRTAQIEVLKQDKWKSPYYWAAFELQGSGDKFIQSFLSIV